jgi:HlyD family secretion protein
MSTSSTTRRVMWILALVLLIIGTPVAGILYSYSSTGSFHLSAATTEKPPPSFSPKQGVVCFGNVDLLHGVSNLYPTQPGRVTEIPVHEGDMVIEGAVLLRVDDRLALSRVKEAEAALESAQLQLDQAHKQPELYRSKIAQQQDSVNAMHSRLDAARHTLERKKELVAKQLIDRTEITVSEDQVKEAEAMSRVEEQRLADLKKQDPQDDVRRAEKEVAVMQARVSQARLTLDDCVVKAPRRGTILRILVGPGDVLAGQPKQPAIQFAIDGPQVIRADVEQEFVERVAVGQRVTAVDETHASQTWRGKVERIANWFTQRRAVMDEPTAFQDVRTAECLITLEADQPPLRIGQRMRVYIGSAAP